MKILCGPDLHIRVTAPEHRIDDFEQTQKDKISWIMKLDWEVALFPGDVTDHPKLPYHITQHYIRVFRTGGYEIFVVKGQHDLLYHVSFWNTPFATMEAGGAFEIAGKEPFIFSPKDAGPSDHIGIYGASWGEEIPEIDPIDELRINILLIHKMFVDDKLWEGQEEYERANIFLTKNEWDLIVSGDNHQHFMFQSRGKFHVNCGSLMRQNIDQIHHKPVVYIYDTETKTLTPHYIPIKPIEEVMDLEKAEKYKEDDELLESFVEKVGEDTEVTGLDYVKNLDERLAKDDIEEGVRHIGKEIVKNAAERVKHR